MSETTPPRNPETPPPIDVDAVEVRPRPSRPSGTRAAVIVALLVLIAVVAPIAYGATWAWREWRAVSDRIAAVQTQIRGVAEQVKAAGGGQPAMSELEARFRRIEAAFAASAAGEGDRLAGLQQRLAALEAAAREKAAAVDLGPLEARIDDLKKTQGALTAHVAALDEAIGAVKAELTSALAARLPERIAALEESARGNARAIDTVAAVTAALQPLRDALRAGRPYRAELDRLGRFAPKPPPEGFDTLAESAASGVPRLAELQNRFPAAEIVAAAQAAGGDSWWDKTRDRLAGLVSIRRTGEIEGDDVDARVARAERRLAEGDAAAALAEVRALPPAAAEAAKGWADLAGRRVAAEQALAALEQALFAGLPDGRQ